MSPLKFLSLAWFTPVMGLAGLSLAWARAASLMGSAAEVLSAALAVLAFAVFLVLMVLQLRRAVQFPQAVAEDLNHPVRHAFVATIPVGLLLLIACGVRWFGPQSWLSILWFGVASAQLWVTWWVLSKWLKPGASDANGVTTPMWAGITPVLFVPVVGNVVAPLAGIALGHTACSFGLWCCCSCWHAALRTAYCQTGCCPLGLFRWRHRLFWVWWPISFKRPYG